MHVQIRAQNPGHPFSYRAGRQFPVGTYVRMEVMAEKDDVKVDSNGNGPLLENGTLDMTRINEAGWSAIKRDSVHFSVFADSETSGGISVDVIDGLKRRLTEANTKISELQIENDTIRGALVKAEGSLAAFKAELAAFKAATVPVQDDVAAAPAVVEEAAAKKKK